ncbi:MAG: helix-turn-helix transcriptional regulator [Deltaproteobacteria bacterium]|jgi:DNA-binding XRE family transcriptional regulator|nr:helix-turn-helix transcriptional regulator [Deltaproteobacteria bacterium]
MKNRVKEIREAQLMSKAELARKAGLSPVTIDRIENGAECRMSTMRKIILALGMKLTDRNRVFPENDK